MSSRPARRSRCTTWPRSTAWTNSAGRRGRAEDRGPAEERRWVRQAVTLYRRADGGPRTMIRRRGPMLTPAAELGAYTGRGSPDRLSRTAARDNLTGIAGRESRRPTTPTDAIRPGRARRGSDGSQRDDDDTDAHLRRVDPVAIDGDRLPLQCRGADQPSGRCPRRSSAASTRPSPSATSSLARAGRRRNPGYAPARSRPRTTPSSCWFRRAANALFDRMRVRSAGRARRPTEQVRIDLPAAVQSLLDKAEPQPAKPLHLGQTPDRVRVAAASRRIPAKQFGPAG